MNKDARIFSRRPSRSGRQRHRSPLAGRRLCELRRQTAVEQFFAQEKPDFVFLAAAKVGCILANDSCPADFIRDNLQIQTNVIDASYRHGATKLLFLGSSCIYPKHAPSRCRRAAC